LKANSSLHVTARLGGKGILCSNELLKKVKRFHQEERKRKGVTEAGEGRDCWILKISSIKKDPWVVQRLDLEKKMIHCLEESNLSPAGKGKPRLQPKRTGQEYAGEV